MAIHDPELLDALERLGSSPFQGRVWRHMFNDHPPELANTRGARWNPAGVSAIYTSLEREVAFAEAQHAIDSQPVRPRPRRRVMYELELSLETVVDLTGGRHLEIGLTDEELTSDDPSACQAVGAAVAWLGWDGLLVPSVRVDGSNAVILVDTLSPDAAFERIGEQDITSAE
jgi:RES domain-containing protein